MTDITTQELKNIIATLAQEVIKNTKELKEERIMREKELQEERIIREKELQEERIIREKKLQEERIVREKEYKKIEISAEKRRVNLDKKMEEMIAVYKKAGLIQGKVAEETIYRSIAPLFAKKGKEFTKVEKNIVVKKEGKRFAEYDILAINGNEVMPIEVKNNVTTNDVDHFLNTQIPKFRESFPEYKNYKLYAGIGGLVVSKSVENYAQKKGLYVFIQNGENVRIANNNNFEAKSFA